MKSKFKILICIIIVILIGVAIYFYKFKTTKNEENDVTKNYSQINEEITNKSDNDEKSSNNNNELNINNELNTNNGSKSNIVSKTDNNTSTSNDLNIKDNNVRVVKSVSPSGFAGSSLYVVRLYSDGSVYAITYNGEGFDDSNIVLNKLVATNAEDINNVTYDDYDKDNSLDVGAVVIKGSSLNVIDNNYGWIIFKKS